jgi:hypothetical protein
MAEHACAVTHQMRWMVYVALVKAVQVQTAVLIMLHAAEDMADIQMIMVQIVMKTVRAQLLV